jgi:probable rRNA maturation factor
VAQETLNALGRPTADCSVVVVDDAAIATLNRTYRRVAGPTDVLAFPMTEGAFGELTPDCLGDVVISAETAARQARWGDVRAELALLLVHGILHLVGYDHGTVRERRRMWQRQEAILAACGIPVPGGWASRSADV